MKIIRRKYAKWTNEIGLVLPTIIVYSMEKLARWQFNKLEYIWWITIPVLILIYLCFQFTVSNEK
jgi:hypothetical protein